MPEHHFDIGVIVARRKLKGPWADHAGCRMLFCRRFLPPRHGLPSERLGIMNFSMPDSAS